MSIKDYFDLAGEPDQFYAVGSSARKRLAWHNENLLQNPLCAEFGIRNMMQLDHFIKHGLPHFSMVSYLQEL